MACSLQTLLPELLCLIYQSCDSFEQAAGLASTCRHAQRVWQINQYGIIKHIIRHRTYAWHAAQDLARLQVKLDQALGAPLPADYAMVVIPAPACLPRLDRHLFGNHEYATAACRAFQVQWSYQRSRGPEREVLKLRTSEVERFHAAFYMRVAFVVANYDALPSPSHPMRLHNPGLKRLQLPLVELWALVEMTQVFELPGLFMNVPSKDAMKQYRYDPTRPHDPYSWEAPRSWKRALDHIRDTYRERRHRAGFSEGFPSFPLAVEDVFSSWSDDEEMQRHLQRSHPEGRDYVPELDATDDDR